MSQRSAITKINQRGILLVFPINNAKEPSSLWSEFFPRTKMRWEWDDSGDDKVANMWYLMKKLSDCRQVIYSKWYQGRATFFSIPLFQAMWRIMNEAGQRDLQLPRGSRILLEILEGDSPISTKDLKRMAEMKGRDNEGLYNRSMKVLFQRFLAVAYGEVDDGAFPSLAVGATKNLYEEICLEAERLSLVQAQKTVNLYMPAGSKVRKFFDKVLNEIKSDTKAPPVLIF